MRSFFSGVQIFRALRGKNERAPPYREVRKVQTGQVGKVGIRGIGSIIYIASARIVCVMSMCVLLADSMERKNKFRSDKRVKKADGESGVSDKKPFNKKKYREQKYSNNFKVKQWEERRKKAVVRQFYRDMKKEEKIEKLKFPKKDNSSEPGEGTSDTTKKEKKGAFFSAKQEFQRKQEEKKRKQEEILKAKQEREEALKKYKEKKKKMYIELSKKTKKGQPVMKGRMEMLLEKIQQMNK